MSKTILDVAKSLNHGLIEEIIELSERRIATRDGLYYRHGIPKSGFVRGRDIVQAERSAINLPDKDLKRFLKSLTQRQMIELTALAWLGRGDGPTRMSVEQSFICLCVHARETACPDDLEYLMHKPLKEYFTQALQLDPEDEAIDELEIEMKLGL